MAISKNFLLKGVRGTLNKQIVIRDYGDKVVLSDYPDMDRRKLSPKQVRRIEIMKLAYEELRSIKADQQLRDAAQLRLNVPSNKLHHALLQELLLKYGKEVNW
jgi:valyl-tRNA synthetase